MVVTRFLYNEFCMVKTRHVKAAYSQRIFVSVNNGKKDENTINEHNYARNK